MILGLVEVHPVFEQVQIDREPLRMQAVGDALAVLGVQGGLLGCPVSFPERELVTLVVCIANEISDQLSEQALLFP